MSGMLLEMQKGWAKQPRLLRYKVFKFSLWRRSIFFSIFWFEKYTKE